MQPFLLINTFMANFLSGFLNNLTQGLGNPKGTMGDFAHAARLYNSNAFRLAPKVKFLYHVVFNINPAAARATRFDTQKHGTAVNMLVKQVDLPKFTITVDNPNQYNRKKRVHTKLEYDPINVVFHDDNVGLTTALWTMYYNYYFADSKTPTGYLQNSYRPPGENKYRYGLDNDFTEPFFTSIQIYQLERHTYHAFTLINPIISNWQHDTMNNELSESVASTMILNYETVLYGTGSVYRNSPVGFATEYYDHMPSPLLVAGGGTTSLFGQGGAVDGITGVLGSVLSGRAFTSVGAFVGTIGRGINTANNIKKLTKEGVTEEGYRIVKGVLGTATGTDVSGVANVLFPKTNSLATNDRVNGIPPVERYSKTVQDASTTFAAQVKKDPIKYENAIATIGKTAVISGVPSTAADFRKLNATQKTDVVNKIVNEYENGNTKVVGLVNTYITL